MSPEVVETDLLAAIAAEPDAVEPRVIYADWLLANDDPRGELIMVQTQLVTKPDDEALRRRETELLEIVTKSVLDLTADDPIRPGTIVRWHLGFVDALQLTARTIHQLRGRHPGWLAHPALSQVRELDIASKYARSLRVVRGTPLARSVRVLRFGSDQPLDEPTLAAVARELPRLEELHLRCRDVPNLVMLAPLPVRKLSLELLAIAVEDITRIGAAPWKLAALGLQPRLAVAPDVYEALSTLFDGTLLPAVKHFELAGNMPMIEVIDTIAITRKPGDVTSVALDLQRIPRDQQLRVERHREALAQVTFQPVLGHGPYYDSECCQSVAAFLNHRLERPADALGLYQQALRIRPENRDARHGLAIALRKLKRFDESLAAFDTLIDPTRSPSASILNGRHYTLCELGRHAEARADLERAVTIDPNDADIWNNLGCERQYAGDVEGAFAAFRRTIELDANHGYARRNEGELLLEIGRPAEALPIFVELLARTPGETWLMSLRAQAELEAGDAATARLTLDARIGDGRVDNIVRCHVLRALAHHQLGVPAKVLADLDVAVRETDCPSWVALAMFVRSLVERDAWTRVIGDDLVAPSEIAVAMTAHARATRPAGAGDLHDPGVGDQLDCGEVAVLAALHAGNRELATRRTQALAAHYIAQGPTFHRKWWTSLGAVVTVVGATLEEGDRALLRDVLRATRGRMPIGPLAG